MERFDTAVRRWDRLCELPTARSGCAAVALFGLLYVIGGKGSEGQILSSVERFDPSIGWWQMLPPVTMPRSASAAAAVGGKVYVAGGFNGNEDIRAVETFDPLVGRWEEIAESVLLPRVLMVRCTCSAAKPRGIARCCVRVMIHPQGLGAFYQRCLSVMCTVLVPPR